MQKYPFASARGIAQHFLTTVPTIRDMLQRELGMRKFSRRWISHFLTLAQKLARVEAPKAILQVLQYPESNDFEGIATGDELDSGTIIHFQQCLRRRYLRLFQRRPKQLARKKQ
jgi:hypothetical protein